LSTFDEHIPVLRDIIDEIWNIAQNGANHASLRARGATSSVVLCIIRRAAPQHPFPFQLKIFAP